MLRIKIRPTAHPIVRLLVTGKSTDIRHFVKTTAQQNIGKISSSQQRTSSQRAVIRRSCHTIGLAQLQIGNSRISDIHRSCIKISLRKLRLCGIDIRTVSTQTSFQALIFITS